MSDFQKMYEQYYGVERVVTKKKPGGMLNHRAKLPLHFSVGSHEIDIRDVERGYELEVERPCGTSNKYRREWGEPFELGGTTICARLRPNGREAAIQINAPAELLIEFD